MSWYVILSRPNSEDKVSERVLLLAEEEGFESIKQAIVPKNIRTKSVRGKMKEVQEKIYPSGYVFLEISPEINDLVYSKIKDVQGVTGFIGERPRKLPPKLTPKEVSGLLEVNESGTQGKADTVLYNEGMTIKIVDGPFASFNGVISSVNAEKETLVVDVLIFGRPTPTEFSFNQVSLEL